MWTKERIIALNKLICEASDQPHAIRDEGTLEWLARDAQDGDETDSSWLTSNIANRHPFVEGNKRTAACIAICETLKNI